MNDLEEDIKILEKINITTYGTKEELEALEIDLSQEELNQIIKNLINKYKEQENTIDLMAEALLSYANLGLLIKCPAEYDGKYFYKNCKIDVTKRRTNKTHYLCKECVKEYFKKKAKGE